MLNFSWDSSTERRQELSDASVRARQWDQLNLTLGFNSDAETNSFNLVYYLLSDALPRINPIIATLVNIPRMAMMYSRDASDELFAWQLKTLVPLLLVLLLPKRRLAPMIMILLSVPFSLLWS